MIFVDACLRKPTERPPIWFMRQAGRYLPEFRAIRAEHGFIEVCETPELVKEVTMQPIRRFDCDAAIIFADILLPFTPMGLKLRYEKGVGPMVDNPLQNRDEVEAMPIPDFEKDMGYLGAALDLTREALPDEKALIGFGGAPFTLACYALEQKMGKTTDKARQWMFGDPEAFQALIDKFTDMTIAYFRYQAQHGIQAIQLFDTWGGTLSAYDFNRYLFPSIKRIMAGTADLGIPRILFVKGSAHLRYFLPETGADVIGLDWTMPIAHSRRMLGDHVAVQGNLDPAVLYGNPDYIRERTRAMLEANGTQPGHIANLGHGIHKDTPVENVGVFVETVREFRYER